MGHQQQSQLQFKQHQQQLQGVTPTMTAKLTNGATPLSPLGSASLAAGLAMTAQPWAAVSATLTPAVSQSVVLTMIVWWVTSVKMRNVFQKENVTPCDPVTVLMESVTFQATTTVSIVIWTPMSVSQDVTMTITVLVTW